MKKIFLFLLFFIAAVYVFITQDKIYTFPLQRNIDLTGCVSYFDKTDKWLGVISERNLYIATADGRVLNIISLDADAIFSYHDYDVAIDGDSFIIYGTDNYSGTAFFASEKLARINANGKFEGYIFRINHSREEKITFLDELEIKAHDGKVYLLEDKNQIVTLSTLLINGDQDQKPEIVEEIHVPMEVADGYINLQTNKIYLQLLSGDIYIYDMPKKTLQKLEGTTILPPEAVPDKTQAEHLTLSSAYFAYVTLFYLALVILGTGVLVLFWKFLGSRAFRQYRIVWLVSIVAVMAVWLLSEQFMLSKGESAENRLAAIANVTQLTLQNYLDAAGSDFTDCGQQLALPDMQQKIRWSRAYLDSVCRKEGASLPLYLVLYAVDKDYKTYALASSDHVNYAGQKMEDLKNEIQEGKIKLGSQGRSYEFKDPLGMMHIEDRYLYNNAGSLVYILEAGGDIVAFYTDMLSRAVTLLLHLAALLGFWWVFIDRLSYYRQDIVEYLHAHERRSITSRLRLGGIYFFLLNVILHLDYVLLVMITAYIGGQPDSMQLAAMLIIPLTGYRVGTFGGSVIASSFIRFFGERKSGYIGSVMTILSFVLLIYACVEKNLYILAAGKCLQGFFLGSVLYCLAEGLPFEIKDETEKTRQIALFKDGGSGSIIIGIMLAGIVAEYGTYWAIYLFGAIGAAVLLVLGPLALRTPQEEAADDAEALNAAREIKPAGNAWLAFLKPRVMIYLGMIVAVYALAIGYADYVFPLFAQSCNISDMELSNMGVIANTAAFVGIESFLPQRRFRPIVLMAAAFAICGLALGFLVLNSSMFCAFAVFLIFSFVGRAIDNYKELELTRITDRYGFDAKDVQANYYAAEDGIRILQAPALGILCSVSVSFCCIVLGALCLLVPAAYVRFIDGRFGKKTS